MGMERYGERQERAEMLVRNFRARPDAGVALHSRGVNTYTSSQLADEIENFTELGRDIVAVAGLVIHALNSTPEFFERQRKRKHLPPSGRLPDHES